ncbi:hypothetical protein PG990_014930 [Apiospora arundinis]
MPPVFERKPDLLGLHSWCAEFNGVREPIQGYDELYLTLLSEINPHTDDITLFTGADDPDWLTKLSQRFNLRPPIFTPMDHGEPAGPKKRKKKRKKKRDGSRHANVELEGASRRPCISGLPEAKRRLVIVVNLDEPVLWALIKTASSIQAAAIRSFISNHLALKASLETSITPTISRTFEMKFVLPFYAVRDYLNGGPYHDLDRLRNMERIDFLQYTSWSDTRPLLSEYIYQAGTSCLVTGQDHHIWTAHAIFDGCHEYEDGGVLEDYEDHKNQHGLECDMVDPITGKIIAWPSITPREFFLGVLELRSEQAKREWQRTIKRILTRCDIGRKWHDERLECSIEAPAGHDHEVDDSTEKKAYSDWIHRVITLLERLRRSLVECISVWDAFAEGDIHYFIPSGNDPHMMVTQSIQLVAIKRNFKQMATLLQSMDMISDELKSRMNELGHRLEYENNERARAQIAAAMDMKILTWLTFHSLPFTLVAAFMSARPEVLPFPGTIATPLITFFVIEAVIWFTLDRFFEGRYVAKVKNAAGAFYYWARHTVHYMM